MANATTETLGEVAYLNGGWSNIEKARFKFFTQNGLVIQVFLIFGVRPVNLTFKILFFGNFTGD